MYIFYLFLYLIPDACYFVHTLACFAIASARDLHSVHFHENLVDLKSHISYISESCLHGKYCNSQSFFCAFCALNLYTFAPQQVTEKDYDWSKKVQYTCLLFYRTLPPKSSKLKQSNCTARDLCQRFVHFLGVRNYLRSEYSRLSSIILNVFKLTV